MFITNTAAHKGKELGLVTGEYVSSRVFYHDFFSSVRNFFGLELKSYTKMLADAKSNAIKTMIVDAESLGATSIVNVKFTITVLTNDAMVVLVSGTAICG